MEMTTDYAAWLVKNEVAIIAKEMRRHNKAIVKPKAEGAPLKDDNYMVRFKNVHSALAIAITHRYHNKEWGYGKILLTAEHIPAQKIVIINIENV